MATLRGAGSVVFSTSGGNLTPTVTHSVGDLLLLYTAQRAGAESCAAMTGWTQLAETNANGSLEIWARIADGGANDAPTVDWSGTTFCNAWIEAWYDAAYTDLGTIVHASNAQTASGSTTLFVPSLTITENDCLVITAGRKNKTSTSNGNTFAAPGSFTERQEYVYAGTGNAMASASWQQTTAANVPDTDWTLTGTGESLASNALVLALRTGSALTKKLKALVHSAAQSKTGVYGDVFAAPTDGGLAGERIGRFSAQAFEASLESGEAVIKVPVSAFGGSALTTSDTPRAEFRYDDAGTLKTTGLIPCTVIEE